MFVLLVIAVCLLLCQPGAEASRCVSDLKSDSTTEYDLFVASTSSTLCTCSFSAAYINKVVDPIYNASAFTAVFPILTDFAGVHSLGYHAHFTSNHINLNVTFAISNLRITGPSLAGMTVIAELIAAEDGGTCEFSLLPVVSTVTCTYIPRSNVNLTSCDCLCHIDGVGPLLCPSATFLCSFPSVDLSVGPPYETYVARVTALNSTGVHVDELIVAGAAMQTQTSQFSVASGAGCTPNAIEPVGECINTVSQTSTPSPSNGDYTTLVAAPLFRTESPSITIDTQTESKSVSVTETETHTKSQSQSQSQSQSMTPESTQSASTSMSPFGGRNQLCDETFVSFAFFNFSNAYDSSFITLANPGHPTFIRSSSPLEMGIVLIKENNNIVGASNDHTSDNSAQINFTLSFNPQSTPLPSFRIELVQILLQNNTLVQGCDVTVGGNFSYVHSSAGGTLPVIVNFELLCVVAADALGDDYYFALRTVGLAASPSYPSLNYTFIIDFMELQIPLSVNALQPLTCIGARAECPPSDEPMPLYSISATAPVHHAGADFNCAFDYYIQIGPDKFEPRVGIRFPASAFNLIVDDIVGVQMYVQVLRGLLSDNLLRNGTIARSGREFKSHRGISGDKSPHTQLFAMQRGHYECGHASDYTDAKYDVNMEHPGETFQLKKDCPSLFQTALLNCANNHVLQLPHYAGQFTRRSFPQDGASVNQILGECTELMSAGDHVFGGRLVMMTVDNTFNQKVVDGEAFTIDIAFFDLYPGDFVVFGGIQALTQQQMQQFDDSSYEFDYSEAEDNLLGLQNLQCTSPPLPLAPCACNCGQDENLTVIRDTAYAQQRRRSNDYAPLFEYDQAIGFKGVNRTAGSYLATPLTMDNGYLYSEVVPLNTSLQSSAVLVDVSADLHYFYTQDQEIRQSTVSFTPRPAPHTNLLEYDAGPDIARKENCGVLFIAQNCSRNMQMWLYPTNATLKNQTTLSGQGPNITSFTCTFVIPAAGFILALSNGVAVTKTAKLDLQDGVPPQPQPSKAITVVYRAFVSDDDDGLLRYRDPMGVQVQLPADAPVAGVSVRCSLAMPYIYSRQDLLEQYKMIPIFKDRLYCQSDDGNKNNASVVHGSYYPSISKYNVSDFNHPLPLSSDIVANNETSAGHKRRVVTSGLVPKPGHEYYGQDSEDYDILDYGVDDHGDYASSHELKSRTKSFNFMFASVCDELSICPGFGFYVNQPYSTIMDITGRLMVFEAGDLAFVEPETFLVEMYMDLDTVFTNQILSSFNPSHHRMIVNIYTRSYYPEDAMTDLLHHVTVMATDNICTRRICKDFALVANRTSPLIVSTPVLDTDPNFAYGDHQRLIKTCSLIMKRGGGPAPVNGFGCGGTGGFAVYHVRVSFDLTPCLFHLARHNHINQTKVRVGLHLSVRNNYSESEDADPFATRFFLGGIGLELASKYESTEQRETPIKALAPEVIFKPSRTCARQAFASDGVCNGPCPAHEFYNDISTTFAVSGVANDHPNSSNVFDDVVGINATALRHKLATDKTDSTQSLNSPYDAYFVNNITDRLTAQLRDKDNSMVISFQNISDAVAPFLSIGNVHCVFTFESDVIASFMDLFQHYPVYPFSPGVYLGFNEPAKELTLQGMALGNCYLYDHNWGQAELCINQTEFHVPHPGDPDCGEVPLQTTMQYLFIDMVIPNCTRDTLNQDADIISWAHRLHPGQLFKSLWQVPYISINPTTIRKGTVIDPLNADFIDDGGGRLDFVFDFFPLIPDFYPQIDPTNHGVTARFGDGIDDTGMLGALPGVFTFFAAYKMTSTAYRTDEFTVFEGQTAYSRMRFTVFPCKTADCPKNATHRLVNNPQFSFADLAFASPASPGYTTNDTATVLVNGVTGGTLAPYKAQQRADLFSASNGRMLGAFVVGNPNTTRSLDPAHVTLFDYDVSTLDADAIGRILLASYGGSLGNLTANVYNPLKINGTADLGLFLNMATGKSRCFEVFGVLAGAFYVPIPGTSTPIYVPITTALMMIGGSKHDGEKSLQKVELTEWTMDDDGDLSLQIANRIVVDGLYVRPILNATTRLNPSTVGSMISFLRGSHRFTLTRSQNGHNVLARGNFSNGLRGYGDVAQMLFSESGQNSQRPGEGESSYYYDDYNKPQSQPSSPPEDYAFGEHPSASAEFPDALPSKHFGEINALMVPCWTVFEDSLYYGPSVSYSTSELPTVTETPSLSPVPTTSPSEQESPSPSMSPSETTSPSESMIQPESQSESQPIPVHQQGHNNGLTASDEMFLSIGLGLLATFIVMLLAMLYAIAPSRGAAGSRITRSRANSLGDSESLLGASTQTRYQQQQAVPPAAGRRRPALF